MASASTFEINDTLQITRGQWFPEELVLEKHLENPYTTEDVEGKVFSFRNKPWLRNFVAYPVRVFLVENRDRKWIYWGLCQVLETTIDYVKRETSGKYRIIRVNNPEEMKWTFQMIHTNPDENYFW